MAFHVFVEGATDDTPAGVERLASAIARHYGLPAADLLVRLQRGRFRVKGNIDRELADKYCRDLVRLGARCVVEEATADNSARATPIPFPAVRPATPPVGIPAAGSSRPATPAPLPRPSTPSPLGDAPPSRPTPPPSALAGVAPSRPTPPPSALAGVAPSRPTPPPSALAGVAPSGPAAPPSALAGVAPKPGAAASSSSPYQSGLAAAFAPSDAPSSLGALDSENVSFSLASVDGADEQAPASPAAFAPPEGAMSASIGPPPDPAKVAAKPGKPDKPDKPRDVPLDLFAPPDAQDAELAVDLAADEPLRRKSEPVIPVPAEAAAEPAMRHSQPSLQARAPVTVAPSSHKLGPLGDLRVRFAAGVLLALLVGFVPAHVVASIREDGYKAIDNQVIAAQQLADTPDAYAQLDRLRADQLERKRGEQRNTAIIALAIWGIVGGAVAFAWFKKVPWERFD